MKSQFMFWKFRFYYIKEYFTNYYNHIMLQQLANKPEISQDADTFDPYAREQAKYRNQQEENLDDESYSSGDDEMYSGQIKREIKQNHIRTTKDQNQEATKSKAKVYHTNHFTKLDTKINLHKINNEINTCQQKQLAKEARTKDKADRATVEQVLDQRTRRILLKLINNDIVSEINGCISTGKEANVYHAINTTTKKEYAIKIYKTSILIFKDRDRYVEGEFRFRRGYCSSNPRKMVSMWAQKQLRNLKRMEGVIPSPVGLLVKSNVLVMDFLGKDMINAPRLRDSNVRGVQKWSMIYLQVLKIMRVLYQQCKLIHADLSQYNMLYWQDTVYVIDVSQSVEHDHPHALDFLRRDIININDFFKKRSVRVFSDWNIFQFIVALDIKKGEEISQLQQLMDEVQNDIEDNVFKKITIPRTLGSIPMEKVEKQLFDKIITSTYHKVVTGMEGSNQIKQVNEDEQSNSDSSSSSNSSDSQDEDGKQTIIKGTEEGVVGAENEEENKKRVGGKQKYEGLSKMQRKHKVKQEKRQKRKDKLPKKQKKKLTRKH